MPSGNRPYVLTVAGFDPSGGAGLLADCKTFETQGCMGLAVMTANTLQTGSEFLGCHWVPNKAVRQQLELMLTSYPIGAVKFGIVPDAKALADYRALVARHLPSAPTVIDTVLSATASGFRFSHARGHKLLKSLAPNDLITPNSEEYERLFPQTDPRKLSRDWGIHLLIKGGHTTGRDGVVTDQLFTPTGMYEFSVPRSTRGKHGTGCILSASIAACLALGMDAVEACAISQLYVARYIDSAEGRLGSHYGLL